VPIGSHNRRALALFIFGLAWLLTIPAAIVVPFWSGTHLVKGWVRRAPVKTSKVLST
jgi:hypothetical protein